MKLLFVSPIIYSNTPPPISSTLKNTILATASSLFGSLGSGTTEATITSQVAMVAELAKPVATLAALTLPYHKPLCPTSYPREVRCVINAS